LQPVAHNLSEKYFNFSLFASFNVGFNLSKNLLKAEYLIWPVPKWAT